MSAKPIYLWFDLEFTDLDPNKARILQVAALLTDVHLKPLKTDDTGLNISVALPEGAPVSAWVEENLADLVALCRSDKATPADQVEAMLLDYLSDQVGTIAENIQERPVLSGNSVHNDWRLAAIHYPQLIAQLNYRLLDVSTLKQQWLGWLERPEFDKEDATIIAEHLPFEHVPLEGRRHDALYDVLASIAELNYYRQYMLMPPMA